MWWPGILLRLRGEGPEGCENRLKERIKGSITNVAATTPDKRASTVALFFNASDGQNGPRSLMDWPHLANTFFFCCRRVHPSTVKIA